MVIYLSILGVDFIVAACSTNKESLKWDYGAF